jgi:hypothetical protein
MRRAMRTDSRNARKSVTLGVTVRGDSCTIAAGVVWASAVEKLEGLLKVRWLLVPLEAGLGSLWAV